MPLYHLTHQSLVPIEHTTLQLQAFRERQDLQRLLKRSISVLGDDLFVVAEEFSQWADSRRRIDILALHKSGRLVVIELKRTEDGGHMDLQALRYAAMVSTLTFEQAIKAHAVYEKIDDTEAERRLRAFLGLAGVTDLPEGFAEKVEIVLVSPDFSRELTTAVLWLNTHDLTIRCIRLRPHQLNGETILDVEQVIPLPEAEEYMVRMKEKEEEKRAASEGESTVDFTRYDLSVNGQLYSRMWKRNLLRQVIASAAAAGLSPERLAQIIPERKMILVEGHLRGESFLAAAQAVRAANGYVFRPQRLFLADDELVSIGNMTMCLSNQWGITCLPLIDDIIASVPSAHISYKASSELT